DPLLTQLTQALSQSVASTAGHKTVCGETLRQMNWRLAAALLLLQLLSSPALAEVWAPDQELADGAAPLPDDQPVAGDWTPDEEDLEDAGPEAKFPGRPPPVYRNRYIN
ncbi:hypothetical protein BOX15_Mlig025628g1, partial [Macrostomum lignano]